MTWSTTFFTITAANVDGWCWNCPVWSAPHKCSPGTFLGRDSVGQMKPERSQVHPVTCILGSFGIPTAATSHTCQEPWPCNCERPKEIVQRHSQHTPKIMQYGHRSSSVVWSHTWPGPQLNASSISFYSRWSSHNKKNIINQRLWAFRLPWCPRVFVLGLPPSGGFWK